MATTAIPSDSTAWMMAEGKAPSQDAAKAIRDALTELGMRTNGVNGVLYVIEEHVAIPDLAAS